MALFETKCNLTLMREGRSLLVGEQIDLSKERAEEINKVVRGIFPDIAQALVLLELDEEVVEKPKRTRKKMEEVGAEG